MKIVGVGCGPGMLTGEAIRVIESAHAIYGSERAIELARVYIPHNCRVSSIDDFKSLSRLPEDAVILSTGDPMLAGLGYLAGEVVPGISSLQVAAARLHLPLARVVVVVAHGKGHEKGILETILEVKRKKIVFLLTDPKFDVTELYRRLSEENLPIPRRVACCENLGYPNEQIGIGDLETPPMPSAGLYALVIGQF
ncbi:MAG: cobalt-precorrin-7 (C(5))-methyltransferase [Methanoregula sp.]|nr:cobalt-precorrin-7 (C(5))-methyltransferase [Methanoregula sp.]